MIDEFEIDTEFLVSITVHRDINPWQGKTQLSSEELLESLRWNNKSSVASSEDHPKFSALRNALGERGLLRIERSWANGDRVIKPFKLNGITFNPGDAFPCAGAMKFCLNSKQKS